MKKRIRLTESELSQLIHDITVSVLNEADMETYARLWAASKKAQKDLQNGNYQEKLGRVGRIRNNDQKFDRAKAIDMDVLQSALQKHKNYKYMFFAKSGRDIGCRVIFELNSAPKIKDDEIILDGTVTFNQVAAYGKIHIKNGCVRYYKNRAWFLLTPDNRTKPMWDNLLADIQKCLDKRKELDAMI
ncbi:MAG: hypothetical protein K2H57_01320 [Duncaniella sp.]|nr:hypothetical protein [Duncaniella sp.]